MSSLTLDTQLRRRNHKWRWDGENREHILVCVPKTRAAHLLNPVAAIVYAMCDGNTKLGDIAARIARAYGEGRDRIDADVLAFAGYLLSIEVVTPLATAGEAGN